MEHNRPGKAEQRPVAAPQCRQPDQQLPERDGQQDFAPVTDVVRTRTGVIGDRGFGPDPDTWTAATPPPAPPACKQPMSWRP